MLVICIYRFIWRIFVFENYLKDMDRYKGFPYIINKFSYKTCLELGIREGFFSDHLLSTTNIKLYGIDINVSSPNLIKVGSKYKDRFHITNGESPKIADIFPNDYFDFIYIDAAHDKTSVSKDLSAWWPKVRAGGLFAGDDFLNIPDGEHPEGSFGVCESIEEWAYNNNLEYFVTGTDAETYTEKLKHASLMWSLIMTGEHKDRLDFQIPQWWIIKE